MSELKAFILDKIQRKRDKLLGHAMSVPYLKELGGQQVWVADVLVRSDAEILKSVPIAENNRQIKNFVSEGTPVELQRSNAGQFYISGLSDVRRGEITKKTYLLPDFGLAFTDGWRLNTSLDFETGNQNPPEPGTPDTIEHSYTIETIIYGELSYGVTPYGAKRLIRN